MTTRVCNQCGEEFDVRSTEDLVAEFKEAVDADDMWELSDAEEALYLGVWCESCIMNNFVDKAEEDSIHY